MLIKKTKKHKTNSMSIQLENETAFDETFFQNSLPQYYRALLTGFKKTARAYVTLNLFFAALFTTEVFSFFFFLSFLIKSSIFALAIGALFLTCFSYVVLLLYYSSKKPDQFAQLTEQFVISCRQVLPMEPEQHLTLANSLFKVGSYLDDFEKHFYQLPKLFKSLSNLISRFSTYCYAEDVYKMKVLLLETAIEEHCKQIRITPTDLEVHASLANNYVALAKVVKSKSAERHRTLSQLAIEEFSILNHYAPNDPWVHEQLASGYRELEMPENEMQEVETLAKLKIHDKEILYRLGVLYFHQKMNAKGLQVYEELKKNNFKKAEDLISSYGIRK